MIPSTGFRAKKIFQNNSIQMIINEVGATYIKQEKREELMGLQLYIIFIGTFWDKVPPACLPHSALRAYPSITLVQFSKRDQLEH